MDEETGALGRHAEAGSSGARYKGVRLRKWGKWVSEIRLPNSRERIWLGSYDSPEKAARAFDAALYCLRGRHAQFNFPETPPDFAGADGLTPQEIRAVAARFAHEAPETSEQSRSKDDGHGHGTSPSAAREGDDSGSNDMDWSFLNALDDNECPCSGYGLYGGLDYVGGHELVPPPQASATANNTEDENDGGGDCHQPSFLWNF
ncbi:ethylene-responsive transcription factor ERF017-like [Rhodamnia argentea]|uniref:Ethylene-responsive transcription factor ERF017-like n=1 Tax=Rhodamnia argentea TaxID=178133 RepID=A0A8B8PUL9_9MYRT|nr:ethylene-responsive transcription factor ERF017-like [Rhodamnia argentea]